MLRLDAEGLRDRGRIDARMTHAQRSGELVLAHRTDLHKVCRTCLASGVSFESCGYGVTEEQLTGLLAADVHRTHARTSQFSRRTAHGVAHGRRNGGAEIEMPVTVRVGTGKLEEGPRWRVQRVRLRGGVMQGRALKN